MKWRAGKKKGSVEPRSGHFRPGSRGIEETGEASWRGRGRGEEQREKTRGEDCYERRNRGGEDSYKDRKNLGTIGLERRAMSG